MSTGNGRNRAGTTNLYQVFTTVAFDNLDEKKGKWILRTDRFIDTGRTHNGKTYVRFTETDKDVGYALVKQTPEEVDEMIMEAVRKGLELTR